MTIKAEMAHKIRQMLLQEKPKNFAETAQAITLKLTNEDSDKLFAIEKVLGEEEANKWLVNVFVSTGLYKANGKGDVEYIG